MSKNIRLKKAWVYKNEHSKVLMNTVFWIQVGYHQKRIAFLPQKSMIACTDIVKFTF